MNPPATPPPYAHDLIEVRGARENNLKDISLDIPKRLLTVFTGVSGSGKSSLVFGTVAAESQRLINETYSAFLQSFMGSPPRPDVDDLRNLSAAIIVDQERMGANSRSTVGTATDAYSMLRIVFSRLSEPHVGSSNLFSFNDPQGMCPTCEGIGKVSTVDVDAMIDRSKSLNEGAITMPNFGVDTWYWQIFVGSGYFDNDKPIAAYTEDELERFLYAEAHKVSQGSFNSTYEGLVVKYRRLMGSKDLESMQPHVRAAVERISTFATCADCDGTRLNEAARTAKVAGRTIGECASMQISDLAPWVTDLDEPSIAPMLLTLRDVLDNLVEIGLGYLSLDRESGTLSGGEAQRVKMVRHLGSSLTDVTYVFDEPTVGLHPHDVERMNTLLQRLRDKGNTVLVVEHKPDVIAIADHIVDMGPGAGANGGTVTFEGTVAELRASGTTTGNHLTERQRVKGNDQVRSPSGSIAIEHANEHNLRDVSVSIPLGVLVAITGVAGSGKSSLIHGCLPSGSRRRTRRRQNGDASRQAASSDIAIPTQGVTNPASLPDGRLAALDIRQSDTDYPGSGEVTILDQSAIRGSRRSNPATYTGVLEPIRKAFAKANGVKPALFSANSEGACPECKGIGLIYTDLAMMAGVATVCEACEGRRFQPEVLTYTLRELTIADVLDLAIGDARDFFTEKAVRPMLDGLVDVGLGYISLGQPLNTLSGGERQRIKLAIEMAGATGTYVLDEPTSGLHMADVDNLIALLDRLVDNGRSVIVIEHNLDVVARADWVIDLGPGAGHDGGTVVFEGTPADLCASDTSLTGLHLSSRLG